MIHRLAAALALILSLGGCLRLEITTLEYDRMINTSFPPEQTVSGRRVNLTTIYLREGYAVQVLFDETAIPLLPGSGIRDSELDALESGHRGIPVAPVSWECGIGKPATCTNYFVYGVVVNHFHEFPDGFPDETILGRMWTTDNRRAFANFYRHPIVNSDGGKFLRSAAHELGHAFNLHHEDGDRISSIMNETSVVDDHYVYEFSPQEHDHLHNHPVNCVQPGTNRFLFVAQGHPLHDGATPGCR
jgi:hypothetical protein